MFNNKNGEFFVKRLPKTLAIKWDLLNLNQPTVMNPLSIP